MRVGGVSPVIFGWESLSGFFWVVFGITKFRGWKLGFWLVSWYESVILQIHDFFGIMW